MKLRDSEFVLMCAFDYVLCKNIFSAPMIYEEIIICWNDLKQPTKDYFKRQVKINEKECNKCFLKLLDFY